MAVSLNPASRTKHVHGQPVSEVVAELATHGRSGLTTAEARLRLDRYGPNSLLAENRAGPLRRFLKQLQDPLVSVLLVAVVVTLALGQWVDAGVIAGVVLVNAVIGFVQESRARQALDALARMVPQEVMVVRDGMTRRLPAEELVPGDVVLLQAGDGVPADLRLVSVDALEIDESAVTGESLPVPKRVQAVPEDAVLADRVDMAYSGTVVTRGAARGVVVATGATTELGLINRLVVSAGEEQTPLTRKLSGFSRQLAVVIVVLAVVTLVIGLLRGSPFGQTFTAAVALAVGAIPEGLPAAVTIVLAIGVVRMARRDAVVRHLPAVETLGGTTVICTDKTGTLTANKMTVTAVLAGHRAYEVTGLGYAPVGEILDAGRPCDVRGDLALRECLTAGVLCNDAALRETERGWEVLGDPTEAALLVSARKAGLDVRREELPRVDVLPFEPEHQMMATLHRWLDGRLTGYVKGSAERILPLCADWMNTDGASGPVAEVGERKAAEVLAGQGLRVLAFARFTPPSDEDRIRADQFAGRLTLLGFQAMHDPPRPEAMVAVAACRGAGIEVKMITGDHGATARAIAREFAIADGRKETLIGEQIDATPEDRLAEAGVFARVSPEQKLRLVKLLASRGHVVAMTGDGVNDAPALRQADIGVAMGRTGTEVARQAADMVLTDDNFASIEAAVEEGRGVFDNLRKFLAWTLPTNIGEGLVVLVAVVVSAVLPILPVQILWINMTTAVLLGLTLAFEAKEPGIMRRPPRPPKQALLTGDLIRRIFLVSAVLVVGAFGVFEWQLSAGATPAAARTTAINVFVFVQVAYLISCRSLHRVRAPGRNPWLFGGIALMIALQAAITYMPVMNTLFRTAPIGAGAWLAVLAVGALAYLVVEGDKLLWRRIGSWAGERRAGSARGRDHARTVR